jgi:hypothetical protein
MKMQFHSDFSGTSREISGIKPNIGYFGIISNILFRLVPKSQKTEYNRFLSVKE